MTASQRGAPESASTTSWPSGASIARDREALARVVVDDQDAGRRRRRAAGARSARRRHQPGTDGRLSAGGSDGQPFAEDEQQLGGVDGLGDIGGGAGVDAALALPGLRRCRSRR